VNSRNAALSARNRDSSCAGRKENRGGSGPGALSFRIDLRLYTPDFKVIDETEDYLVVDKPPHLMVHPSVPGNPPTLLDGLEALCAYELACGDHLSLINRLDRETSGIVLVAKHKAAARTLGMAMERREFRKSYLAVVWGWPQEDTFLIDGPLLRKGEVEPSPVWVKQIVHPEGKESQTRFEVVRRFERETTNGTRFALVRCHPLTGRMHQIRVHAAHSGHAIVGDKLYGPDQRCYLDFIETGWTPDLERVLLLDRQALHAAFLGWNDRAWNSPLPADLARFCGEISEENGEFIGCKAAGGDLDSDPSGPAIPFRTHP
jgi:23S rRNA pseudouridine1911/1915/1917 synthase